MQLLPTNLALLRLWRCLDGILVERYGPPTLREFTSNPKFGPPKHFIGLRYTDTVLWVSRNSPLQEELLVVSVTFPNGALKSVCDFRWSHTITDGFAQERAVDEVVALLTQ